MEKQKPFSSGKNIFTKSFQQFDEKTFFENLENKIKPQSYFHKYQGFKNTVLALSYLFNVISALTASYLVFWLIKWLTGIAIVAYLLAGIFLFFIEQLKRKSSSEFFQVLFFKKKIAHGWLILSLAIFGLSVTSTYYGTDKATGDFAPTAPIITQDSVLNILYAQLDTTENQINDARKTKWRGTTTRTSQQTIKELTTQKTQLLKAIEQKERNNSSDNKIINAN